MVTNIANPGNLWIEMALLFIQILDIKIIHSRFKESSSYESGSTNEQNVIVHKSLSLVEIQENKIKMSIFPE
ncbi:hypothetical protein NGUA18_00398 [Salmonella enterica]|nr:hypothetical protein SEEGA711_19566 [Salmonella enterica subsp. enterica serovar Gaminara str. ATCC BAA-711]GAR72534.1 hypothetical protein NGUA18_00398 [Salmonella enterica]